MLFYGGGHVICLEVCLQLDDPSDDITDQCRDIIKRLQNVNPTIVEVSVSVCWCVCTSVCLLVSLYICLSVSVFVCTSVCLLVCLFAHLLVCLSVYLISYSMKSWW